MIFIKEKIAIYDNNMITILDDYLKKNIITFLPNEDIFTIEKVNKELNQLLKDNILREYIVYRKHPVVFNKISNYCFICNLRLSIIIDGTNPLNITTCNHLSI